MVIAHLPEASHTFYLSPCQRAFKLHKDHETEIAESLVERIRELQDAGAEVNITTVSGDVGAAQEGR